MNLARWTVRRPVATTMAAAACFLFGTLALRDVPLDLLPELAYPALTVEVPFTGASPQEVESLVVRPVEEAVAVSQGLSRLRSTSLAGTGRVSLLFSWDTRMDLAALEVREKLQQVALPDGAEVPRVLRFDPTLDPILRVAIAARDTSDRGLADLRRLSEERLKPALERLEGVAAARVRGGVEEEIRVLVDPRKAELADLSPDTVAERLAQENVNLAGGILRAGRVEYRVRTLNEFRDPFDVEQVVLARRGEALVALSDVGHVARAPAERELITRLDGSEAVEISIYKASGQNTVAVADRVQERLDELRAPGQLLDGASLAVTSDQSWFIRQALDDLASAAWTGGLLAILVLQLFLRDLRSTLVIAFAIPLSIVTTFLLMRGWGVSLNVMSLGGIALAIGMLVDNAIVVLESIAAQRTGGSGAPETPETPETPESRALAGEEGTGRVSRAVVASTLTTLSVFVPLAFVEGIASRLFADQALTIAFALVVSLVASLSVIPMLAATTLLGVPLRWLGALLALVLLPLSLLFRLGWAALEWLHPRALRPALAHPWITLVVGTAAAAGAFRSAGNLGTDFLPDLHPGILEVALELPRGAGLRETDEILDQLASAARERPEVAHVFATAGAISQSGEPDDVREDVGQLLIRLDPSVPPEAEETVIEHVRAAAARVPGLVPPTFSRPGLVAVRAPLEVLIDGRNLDALRDAAEDVAGVLEATDGLRDVRASARGGRPEIQVALDRHKLAQFDLDAASVSQAIETAVRGRVSTRLAGSEREIPIRVMLPEHARDSLHTLERLVISPPGRTPIPLSTVARVEVAEGPVEIRRESQRRVALVAADVDGRDLGSAAAEIRDRLADLTLPAGVSARVGGSADAMTEALRSLSYAFALAVLLVYLILAAQFESFAHPVIILAAVPLALASAALGLVLTHTTIDVVVMIGAVVLAGIVVNNAILLVDRANQHHRERGLTPRAAVEAASRDRLRPIVMTTATTVLGLAPMLLDGGRGAELRAPLAITVISGLLGATLLTLILIPAAYTAISRPPRS